MPLFPPSRRLSFIGQRQDTVAGLYDFPAREYSYQGRWPSPDPAGSPLWGLAAVDPANPQSWNRYAYVLNNPLALIDPLGLCGGEGDTPDLPCPNDNTVNVSAWEGGWNAWFWFFQMQQTTAATLPDQLTPPTQTGSANASTSGQSRTVCATQFGRDHSLAAGVGAVFGDKVGNNFVTQLFLGNTVSSLAKIGTDVFGSTTPTGSQIASMAIKGAGQGIPGLPPTFNPIVGPTRAAAVSATLSAGYNVIAGVGQETLELGVTSAKVATAVAPLTSTALQTAAAAVAWGKFIFDAGTFAYGAAIACRQ